jgi:hypothetical protein
VYFFWRLDVSAKTWFTLIMNPVAFFAELKRRNVFKNSRICAGSFTERAMGRQRSRSVCLGQNIMMGLI